VPREPHDRADLTWIGLAHGPTTSYPAYSRGYAVAVAGKSFLVGSADPRFCGDASLHNPEDLLVAALSGCHLLNYLAECARVGLAVLEYSDAATGTMQFEGGSGRFVEVMLCPRVVVSPGTDVDLALALHNKAQEVCFIARSVNFPVLHDPTIIPSEADESQPSIEP